MNPDWRTLLILTCLIIGLAITGLNSAAAESEVVAIEEGTSNEGVEFKAKFYSNMEVEIIVRNATERDTNGGFSVISAGSTIIRNQEYDSNDPYPQSWRYNLYKYQNPGDEKQEVIIGFVGDQIEHTYEQTPTADDADEVPLAQLSEIELQHNATGEGIELIISVKDESIHSYAKTITVHTEKTPKAIGRPNDFENGTDTVTIELNEDPGDTVRGEIRLFTGNSDEMNDSLDMVEFEGSVEGETQVQDREYEPVEERGFYRYGDDESDESTEIEITEEDGTPTDTAIAIGILAVGGIVTLLFFLVGTYRRLS